MIIMCPHCGQILSRGTEDDALALMAGHKPLCRNLNHNHYNGKGADE